MFGKRLGSEFLPFLLKNRRFYITTAKEIAHCLRNFIISPTFCNFMFNRIFTHWLSSQSVQYIKIHEAVFAMRIYNFI